MYMGDLMSFLGIVNQPSFGWYRNLVIIRSDSSNTCNINVTNIDLYVPILGT